MLMVDIALMSIDLSHGKVMQQVSLSVMDKVLDQAHLQAEFIHEMLGETSVKTIQHAA